MFDLEQAIADWRRQMLTAGIQTPAPLEELELHLREEIERQMKSGLDEQNAFGISVRQIGQAQPLKMEFKKVEVENWHRLLAWSAWSLFVISFFLPAHRWGGWGWQCAGSSLGEFLSVEFWHGQLDDGLTGIQFHMALLTLANLLMLISPYLLQRFSKNPRFAKLWQASSFLVLTLVWSFMFRLLAEDHRQDIKIGCFVWTMSFLLLFLSTVKLPRRKSCVVAG